MLFETFNIKVPRNFESSQHFLNGSADGLHESSAVSYVKFQMLQSKFM